MDDARTVLLYANGGDRGCNHYAVPDSPRYARCGQTRGKRVQQDCTETLYTLGLAIVVDIYTRGTVHSISHFHLCLRLRRLLDMHMAIDLMRLYYYTI
jgi:hypothetical protein